MAHHLGHPPGRDATGRHRTLAPPPTARHLGFTLLDRTAIDEAALLSHPAVLGLIDADTLHVIVGPRWHAVERGLPRGPEYSADQHQGFVAE
ncbi:MAG TPA: hypothetical protein VN327_10375, partial [Pseudonocardiaceae bacterium]|nr:hypothetical protein [Pseudonocardiaceae bacterium]